MLVRNFVSARVLYALHMELIVVLHMFLSKGSKSVFARAAPANDRRNMLASMFADTDDKLHSSAACFTISASFS